MGRYYRRRCQGVQENYTVAQFKLSRAYSLDFLAAHYRRRSAGHQVGKYSTVVVANSSPCQLHLLNVALISSILLGAPLFLLLAALFWPSAPTLLVAAAVTAFVAGFSTLVVRLPARREDDGDDGAVV